MSNHGYTSVFGLLPTFVEVLDRSIGWGIDRCDDGIVVTAGRFQVTACVTTKGKRFATFLAVVATVRAVSTVCGVHLGTAAEPLESFVWLVLVKKYTV